LERVCEIYEEQTGVAIDLKALKDAFNQARVDIQAEAVERHLEYLVKQELITQEEADEFMGWWLAKPDMLPGLGLGGHKGLGGMRGIRGFCRPLPPIE
jgi:hypothetical protein